jgi:hypothetical protein
LWFIRKISINKGQLKKMILKKNEII